MLLKQHMSCGRNAAPCGRQGRLHHRIRTVNGSRCRAAVQEPTKDAPPKDPFADPPEYKDNFLDKFFIKLYSQKMAAQLEGVAVPANPDYSDFVRISKEIMRGRNAEQQRAVVANVLASLLPEQAPAQFRKLFPPTQWSAEFNAWIAAATFVWLVGEGEVREGDVQVGPEPGDLRKQRSVVHIKRCRYLAESACTGMCVNMCKVPTQNFFTNDFGLPLTMNPNFEDLSCEMIFGQAPPPLHLDPANHQPCFARCSLASTLDACPKTADNRHASEQVQAAAGVMA